MKTIVCTIYLELIMDIVTDFIVEWINLIFLNSLLFWIYQIHEFSSFNECMKKKLFWIQCNLQILFLLDITFNKNDTYQLSYYYNDAYSWSTQALLSRTATEWVSLSISFTPSPPSTCRRQKTNTITGMDMTRVSSRQLILKIFVQY